MCKLKIGYIGNCGEEFSGILQSFRDDQDAEITCVCDAQIKRGLYCVEKYFCSFIEDYHVIMNDPEINLVIVESCHTLCGEVILDAMHADKAVYVILSEKTMMEIHTISASVRDAQSRYGKTAVFVTVDELDNEFFANLPIAKNELGKLLNVSISLSGGDRSAVKLQRCAYDSVRRLYELLGRPERMVSVSNGNQGMDQDGKNIYSAAAVFGFPCGAIANVMIGGPYQGEGIHIYGTKGAAEIHENEICYNLGDGWRSEIITAQDRRTKCVRSMVVRAMKNGTDFSQHSITEIESMAKMLQCVLDLESQ